MDQLAVNETFKNHLYQSLSNVGYILPSCKSNAVTVEALLRFKCFDYYCPFADDLVEFIRVDTKLNCSAKYAFSLLQQHVRTTMDKEIPFTKCPTKKYLLSIALLCDRSNVLKLLTETFQINEIVHRMLKGSQLVDYVEPSEQNKMQKILDILHNKKLKCKNILMDYAASRIEKDSKLFDLRADALLYVNSLDNDVAENIKANPLYGVLFGTVSNNALFSLVKEDYTSERTCLQTFRVGKYTDFAAQLLHSHDRSRDPQYADLHEKVTTVTDLQKLDLFLRDLRIKKNGDIIKYYQADVAENASVRSRGSRLGGFDNDDLSDLGANLLPDVPVVNQPPLQMESEDDGASDTEEKLPMDDNNAQNPENARPHDLQPAARYINPSFTPNSSDAEHRHQREENIANLNFPDIPENFLRVFQKRLSSEMEVEPDVPNDLSLARASDADNSPLKESSYQSPFGATSLALGIAGKNFFPRSSQEPATGTTTATVISPIGNLQPSKNPVALNKIVPTEQTINPALFKRENPFSESVRQAGIAYQRSSQAARNTQQQNAPAVDKKEPSRKTLDPSNRG